MGCYWGFGTLVLPIFRFVLFSGGLAWGLYDFHDFHDFHWFDVLHSVTFVGSSRERVIFNDLSFSTFFTTLFWKLGRLHEHVGTYRCKFTGSLKQLWNLLHGIIYSFHVFGEC